MTSFQDWLKKAANGENLEKVRANDWVQSSSGKAFAPIHFLRIDRAHYAAEVGQRGDDFIYHFWPKEGVKDFDEHLAQAFLETFKLEERLQAAYTPELQSWAVRAIGFASAILSDTLAVKVFDLLDRKLA